MDIYNLTHTPAELNYSGCGKAWLALNKNDQPLAIKYMGDFSLDYTKLPKWCRAVFAWLYDRNTDSLSNHELGKLKKAAIVAGHPQTGIRGGHIKASTIARNAKNIIDTEQHKQFSSYRTDCKQQLSLIGEVISGECSCYQFIKRCY